MSDSRGLTPRKGRRERLLSPFEVRRWANSWGLTPSELGRAAPLGEEARDLVPVPNFHALGAREAIEPVGLPLGLVLGRNDLPDRQAYLRIGWIVKAVPPKDGVDAFLRPFGQAS